MLSCTGTSIAAPDPTDRALRGAGMLDVLEARLLSQLDGDMRGQTRSETILQLASVYREMMDTLDPDSPERAGVVQRAWDLADRVGQDEARDLRLALLIDTYQPIERAVALLEVGLLSSEEQGRRAIELSLIHRKFRAIAGSAVPDAVRDERLARTSEDPETLRRSRESSRLRSLASYYAAWSGLMLSVLEDRRPGSDVLPAFGWLLGGEGGQPRLDDIRSSSLELEHVARAAIGVARSKHRLGDTVLATMWIETVAESVSVSDPIRETAQLRKLRFLAEEMAWSDLLFSVYELLGTGDDRTTLPPGDARFLAMRAMETLRDQRQSSDAEMVATLALGDLVRRGEIGHVLDLRSRFGTLPALEDGFVARFAEALDRLEAAESSGSPVRYLDAASEFERAASADDANRFERQRDDARLKRLYCLIRGGRPAQAITVAESFMEADSLFDKNGLEEARWLRIVAIESTQDVRRRDSLRMAVRAYLTEYRGSERAMMLLVRHAGTDLLDSNEGIDGLRSIEASDPIAVDARRVLVRLLYKDWIASKRTEAAVRAELVESVEWIWAQDSNEPAARQSFDIARIALDVGLGGEPKRLDLAAAGLQRAEQAMRLDTTLLRFESEITLFRIEWLALKGRLQDADDAGEPLRRAGDPKAERADQIILVAALRTKGSSPKADAEIDRLIVRLGVRVTDRLIPPAPAPIGASTSGLVAEIVRSAARLPDESGATRDIALRLGLVLLERGAPSAQIVRELAEISGGGVNLDVEWLAWSILLSASETEEPVWWEARFHTLRMLRDRDLDAAQIAYAQHRVLHPMEGPSPWGGRIRGLFDGQPGSESEAASSG